MTDWPVRRARWKPSSGDLLEMRTKLLPQYELATEVSRGFACFDDSQLWLPSAHRGRPILIFDLFEGHLLRHSWNYSSPNARSKSARALQNATKPCRYWSSALATDDCCCKRSLNTIAWCGLASISLRRFSAFASSAAFAAVSNSRASRPRPNV